MFGSKKEIKKMKRTLKNGGILLSSAIAGVLVVYGLFVDHFLIAPVAIGIALMLGDHLEYDVYNKEDN